MHDLTEQQHDALAEVGRAHTYSLGYCQCDWEGTLRRYGDHLADALAPLVARMIADAEQRGRSEIAARVEAVLNPDHSLHPKSGNGCVAVFAVRAALAESGTDALAAAKAGGLRERIRCLADAYLRSWQSHAGAATLDTDVAQMLRNLLVEDARSDSGGSESLAEAWHEGWEAGCNDQQYGDENAQPWTPNPYRGADQGPG